MTIGYNSTLTAMLVSRPVMLKLKLELYPAFLRLAPGTPAVTLTWSGCAFVSEQESPNMLANLV